MYVGVEFDVDDDGVEEIVFYNGFCGGMDIKLVVVVDGLVKWDSYENFCVDVLGIENFVGYGV